MVCFEFSNVIFFSFEFLDPHLPEIILGCAILQIRKSQVHVGSHRVFLAGALHLHTKNASETCS
jgi:hypothetical protein